MAKYRLFAPGPTPVPESVRLRMAESVLHHRTPRFAEIIADVRQGLQWIFQTKEEVLCLSGSGTAGMESAVSNFLSKGDKAHFVNSGKFGERWGKILTAYGCEAIELNIEWGQAVTAADVKAVLKNNPDIKAVYLQASETSTGVAHPIKEIATFCKSLPNTLCIVDAITAIGVFDVALDRDGIDVLVSGSQKAFMLPPGLAFVAVSQKAWGFSKDSDLPKFYLNLAAELKAAQKNNSAYTSSVALVCGLQESLRLLKEEGLEHIFIRHTRLATATQAGLTAIGCTLFADAPSNGLTAVWTPEGVDAEKLVARLRDHYNMTIAGGQEAVKGKIIRVAHMGDFDELDILTVLSAIESALSDIGYDVAAGAGVAAAQKVFKQKK